jgi:hypothetical protein
VHVNIERQARRRPVIGQDRDKIGLQKGCFPTARLAQSASREILLVRCCVPASVLRAKRRCSACRALLDWDSDCPELCLLRHATRPSRPRFARLTCAAGQSRSARKRVTFDGREITCHRTLVAACRMFWCEAGGSREISAVDGEIKAPTSVALIWLGEWEKCDLPSNREPTFSLKLQANQLFRRHPLFRIHGKHDET